MVVETPEPDPATARWPMMFSRHCAALSATETVYGGAAVDITLAEELPVHELPAKMARNPVDFKTWHSGEVDTVVDFPGGSKWCFVPRREEERRTFADNYEEKVTAENSVFAARPARKTNRPKLQVSSWDEERQCWKDVTEDD